MSRIMPSLGTVPRVTFTQPRLPRRCAYPYRYRVRFHSQDELVVACASTDRQQQLQRVGAHHAMTGLPTPPTRTRPDLTRRRRTSPQVRAAASLTLSLASPHQAYHGDIHRAPVAGAGGALQTAAPTRTRLVRRLPYGEIAV